MTAPKLACHRCGAALAELSLPLSRRDECPSCRAELHVCRMCVHFAPRLSRGCDEDDAPDVRDKESANFCDYFRPSPDAFDAGNAAADVAAREQLARLFANPADTSRANVDAEQSSSDEQKKDSLSEAEALFKR